jgi:hypothetical protein
MAPEFLILRLAAGGIAARWIVLFPVGSHSSQLTAIMPHWRR